MKKKANRKYITTRSQYKAVKTFDREQFDEFCSIVYTEGIKDGKKSVKRTELSDVMAAIKTVKGIGDKRLAQIENAVSELFGNADNFEATVSDDN